MFLAGWNVSQLVLDHGEHLANSEEDALRELILVVDGEPAVQNLTNGGPQDLRAGQF